MATYINTKSGQYNYYLCTVSSFFYALGTEANIYARLF